MRTRSQSVYAAFQPSSVPQVVMTGGVAQNYGVVRSIEKLIEQPITTTPFAQSVGAYGAALYALEQVQNG